MLLLYTFINFIIFEYSNGDRIPQFKRSLKQARKGYNACSLSQQVYTRVLFENYSSVNVSIIQIS